jgi:hypothetical protein
MENSELGTVLYDFGPKELLFPYILCEYGYKRTKK